MWQENFFLLKFSVTSLICDCFISLDSEIFRAGALAPSSNMAELLLAKCTPGM